MKLDRPPFVLAHPADGAGCGFHRIMRPCQIMARNGVMSGRSETQFLADHVIKAIHPDIIVVQRQSEDAQVEFIKKYRALLPDAHIVFEVDDALGAVPEKSWHKAYMPHTIDQKLATAVQHCDLITVTTDDLARRMHDIAGGKVPVRVVPNMLGKDDYEQCALLRKNFPPRNPAIPRKLRIGWGGGIGHIGDLEMINPVFAHFKDSVEWVFLGMDPTLPDGVPKQYLGAATPDKYLVSLQGMQLDLMIAPLEDNVFNYCKSNLRLIEAGACAYPTICTKIAPYETNSPPVFAYANTTEEWISAINRFIDTPEDRRRANGEEMLDWAKRFYDMDERAAERIAGWLPKGTRPFKPKLHDTGTGVTTVSTAEELEAAFATTNDILYIRSNTYLSEEAKSRLLATPADIVCGLTNDGGPWGFPNTRDFTALDLSAIQAIDKIGADLTEAILINMGAISGPCALLRRKALSAAGMPPIENLSIEFAILDWSVACKARGLDLKLNPAVFIGSQKPYQALPGETEIAQIRLQSCWPRSDSDEPALKSLREELELRFHREIYHNVPPQNRADYATWYKLVNTRGMRNLSLADKWLTNSFHDTSPDIGYQRFTNTPEPIDSYSEWLFFMPTGTTNPDDASHIISDAILKNPGTKVFYTDHDFVTPEGTHDSPDFKPHTFDFHMFLSRDYLTQSVIIHKSLIPEGFQLSGSSLYGLLLTLSENNRFCHIPFVLSTLAPLRISDIKPAADEKIKILQAYLVAMYQKTGIAINADQHKHLPMLNIISYGFNAVSHGHPLVSIIIPCKDNVEMLGPCISTILAMTKYPNFEILLIDNGSTRKEMVEYQMELNDPRITKFSWPEPYNWSKLNNWATQYAKGEILCFLNDDTRVLSPNWLDEMVGAALIPNIGAVGARLVYPHGLIQHVGVVANSGLTGHIHKGLPMQNPGTNAIAMISHEATAVTGACLVTTKANYDLAGGFMESLAHNFNDVAFCLELRKKGKISVVAAMAELQHFEGITRNAHGLDETAKTLIQHDGEILLKAYPEPDPYWNPNLLLTWVQNGFMVAGMDMANYTFPSLPLPWGKPDSSSVLVIGDAGVAMDERSNSDAIYNLTVVGYTCQILNPPMFNCGPWDTRMPEIAKSALKRLGITKIIVSHLGEAPLQTLAFLNQLELPVEYRPINAESVCPRTNLMPNTLSCDRGYKNNLCQGCMDTNSSPHGNVIMPSYIAEWIRFFNKIDICDLSFLEKPEYREAIGSIYEGTQ